jgi:hypothetical protein
MLEMGQAVDDVLQAAREAGGQLVREGKMSPETLETVSRELLPLEMYVDTINRNFQRALDSREPS